MSNTFGYVIFGCQIPDTQYMEGEELEAVKEMRETCEEAGDPPHVVGWHCTYDQHENLLWFGVSGGKVQNGFGPVPTVSDAQKAEVMAAWKELSEAEQDLVGPPKLQMMVGID